MEPKHITFAKEEAYDKVEASADKVRRAWVTLLRGRMHQGINCSILPLCTQVKCMAPPTAAGEEPIALQNTGHFSLSLSSGRSVGTTRRKASKQKPLYKWELPAEEREALEASMRSTHVTTEHGDFRPGRRMGNIHCTQFRWAI